MSERSYHRGTSRSIDKTKQQTTSTKHYKNPHHFLPSFLPPSPGTNWTGGTRRSTWSCSSTRPSSGCSSSGCTTPSPSSRRGRCGSASSPTRRSCWPRSTWGWSARSAPCSTPMASSRRRASTCGSPRVRTCRTRPSCPPRDTRLSCTTSTRRTST